MISSAQNLRFLVCVLLFFAGILALGSSQAEVKKHVALFVFGDSIYDPGNNNFLNLSITYKKNYPPYGETFFKFPTGRASDGLLIPDFIAVDAKLPLWKPYLAPEKHQFTNGANFAGGGSGVLPSTNPGTLNLEIQLSFFKEVASLLRQQLGDAEAEKLLRNAVYLSSNGGVDYFVLIGNHPNATEPLKREFVKLLLGNITNVVKEIYNMGGRKFAFQNVAPMGCLPSTKQQYNLKDNECLEALTELAVLHNNGLINATKELETQLSDFNFLIFDYYTTLLDRINDPMKYGFKVSDIGCCGSGIYRGTGCGIGQYDLCSNPNEYLFFDGGHPTEHGYSQLAELLWNTGETNVASTTPLSMKQLLEMEIEIEPPEIMNFSICEGSYEDI
ncbi:GDSL esterase/lipase [Melia azedarach]|uniref:GDSL esterase/lipase n=1 Tax=Melia azedarach TaxID=155640 RepID=A0ACC1Y1X0_MELAZ|nr:GDSL esterase/lipase [Melia azedarach]